MDPIMAMFKELVLELIENENISRLEFLKQQLEAEKKIIGAENRLMEKYTLVCDAIDELKHKRKK